MKRTHRPLLAALAFFAMMFAYALTASAQSAQVPVVLRQDLGTPVGSVTILGQHEVQVLADTADFIAVVTLANPSDVATLRFPDERMKLSAATLTIPADFPYSRGISVHTSSPRLEVICGDDSRVELLGHDGDTLRLEFLNIKASGHAHLLVSSPVRADQAVLRADDYATLRHHSISSPDLARSAYGESRLEQIGVEDREEAYSFRISPRIHKYFSSWSFGTTGWSQSPFGGMAAPMGDYTMSTTGTGVPFLQYGAYNISIGVNIFRLRHWDFGIGFAAYGEIYKFPRLMGTTVDAATSLTHLGPVDEPDFYSSPEYAGQERTWQSKLPAVYIQIPLRAEWHRRLDYRGLRLSAELRPGFSATGRQTGLVNECTWTSGSEADKGRVDQHTTQLEDLLHAFRCDLRLDVGFDHISFFVQGALTPLFRTKLKDDLPALDTKVYPLVMGISFNY